jgi:hypothetical protein
MFTTGNMVKMPKINILSDVLVCYVVGVPYSANYTQKLIALFYGYF